MVECEVQRIRKIRTRWTGRFPAALLILFRERVESLETRPAIVLRPEFQAAKWDIGERRERQRRDVRIDPEDQSGCGQLCAERYLTVQQHQGDTPRDLQSPGVSPEAEIE